MCQQNNGHLNKNFNVTGFMKPGSDVLRLKVSSKGAIEKLTKMMQVCLPSNRRQIQSGNKYIKR